MMEFDIKTFDQVGNWDDFVQSHPKGSIFHTAAMCRAMQATKGYRVLAICACDQSGAIRAMLVSVRISTIGRLGKLASRAVMFSEPICTNDDKGCDALATLLKYHDKQMRRRALFTEVRPMFGRGREHDAMLRCGYQRLGYNNYELDLTLPEEQLWEKLNSRARSEIRKSRRRGVVTRKASVDDDLNIFYSHLQQSYSQSGIPLVDKSLFVSILRELPSEQIDFYVAEYQGEPVASCCNLIYGGRVINWYAGAVRISGIAANSCLLWEAIQRGVASGQQVFDFGGAGWVGDEYGPGKFKAKFGGQLVEHGRYRRVYSKWTLKAAETAYGLARRFIAPSQPSASTPETPGKVAS